MRYVWMLFVAVCFFSCEYTIYQPSEMPESSADAAVVEKPHTEAQHNDEKEPLREDEPKEVFAEQKEESIEKTETCSGTLPRRHLYLTTKTQNEKMNLYIVGIRETKDSFLFVMNFRDEMEIFGRKYKAAAKENINIFLFSLDKKGALLWSKHLESKGTVAANDVLAHDDGSFWIAGSYTHDWEIDGVKMQNAPRFTKQPKAQAFVLHFDKQAQALWGKAFEEVDEFASITHQILLGEQKKISVLRQVFFMKDYKSNLFLDNVNAQGLAEKKKELYQIQESGWTLGFDLQPTARGVLNKGMNLEQKEGVIEFFLHPISLKTLLQVHREVAGQGSWAISAVDKTTSQELWRQRLVKKMDSIESIDITSNQTSVTLAIAHQTSIRVGEYFFDAEPYHNSSNFVHQQLVSFYNFSLQNGNLLWKRHWVTQREGVTSFKQQEDGSLWVWGTADYLFDIQEQYLHKFRERIETPPTSYLVRLDPQQKLQVLSIFDTFSTFERYFPTERVIVPKHQPHPFSLVYTPQTCFQLGNYTGHLHEAPKHDPSLFQENFVFLFAPPALP